MYIYVYIVYICIYMYIHVLRYRSTLPMLIISQWRVCTSKFLQNNMIINILYNTNDNNNNNNNV